MSNANAPAYPVQIDDRGLQGGLTKREAFAMAAMQGLLARDDCRPGDSSRDAAEHHLCAVAGKAVRHANALLAELERTA